MWWRRKPKPVTVGDNVVIEITGRLRRNRVTGNIIIELDCNGEQVEPIQCLTIKHKEMK